MPNSRRPTRRDGKAVGRTGRLRAVKAEPNDDSAMAILRRQLERADDDRARIARALAEEKEGRAEDAVELGEMMARVSLAEGRTQVAQEAADELGAALAEERRQTAEREARHALLRAELESLREDARKARTDAPPRVRAAQAAAGGGEGDLARALEASRAECDRMRDSLATLQRRAASIGAGLKEMRDLMVQSAALFDELEERERAIGEIRGKSLREARVLFLRAAGSGEPGAPAPASKPVMEDLSEAAELLEDEVRRSIRPTR